MAEVRRVYSEIGWSWFLLTVPAFLLLGSLFSVGTLPDYDYWYVLNVLYEGSTFTTWRSGILVYSNEHLVSLPAFLYWCNLQITGGSNFGLSLIGWSYCFGQLYLVARANLRPPMQWAPRVVFFLAVGFFLFPPGAWYNFFKGTSGVMWLGSNFWSLAAMYGLWRFLHEGRGIWLVQVCGASLLALFSYSVCLPMFVVLAFFAFYGLSFRSKYAWSVLLWCVLLVCAAVFMSVRPDQVPEPLSYSVLEMLCLLSVLVGVPFSTSVALKSVCGVCGLYLVWKRGVAILRASERRVTFADMILLYSFGNILFMTLFRSDALAVDPETSRYQSLPALLWLSHFLHYSDWVMKKGRGAQSLFLGVVVTLIGMSSATYVPSIQRELRRQEMKGVMELALLFGVQDYSLTQEALIPDPDHVESFYSMVPLFKRIAHRPFSENSFGCPLPGSSLGSLLAGESVQAANFLVSTQPLSALHRRIVVKTPLLAGDCLVGIGADGHVNALAIPARVPVWPESFSVELGMQGWSGYSIAESISRFALCGREAGCQLLPVER